MLPSFKFALREDLKDSGFDFMPTKGEPLASGWDVRCALKDGVNIRPGSLVKIPLGFRSFCPEGWWYELKPRSSTFVKNNLHALYGTIDETYENELLFACHNMGREVVSIGFGERIGQIIPVRRVEMEVQSISNEEFDKLAKNRAAKRSGGFGSTGES